MSTPTPTTALGSAGKTPEQTASGTENFASLFEASLIAGEFGKEGEIVKGTIVAVQRDNVVIDIGGKSEGIIALSEFTDASLPPGQQITVKAGDEVDVYIESRENDDGLVTLSKEKADKMKVWDEISAACERDELIEGTISQRVKGGLSVTIRGGVKAFLPGSQVDLRPIRNLDKLIGQTYQFKVIKFNKKRGNIVLARRVLLEKERDEQKTKTLETLEEGKVVTGVIKNITEYGAFVDLGGIDGLLHITDMSWGRVNHPSELFQVGDEVTVRVLKYNPETERVSLGLKQTQEDPVEPRRRGVPAGQEGARQGAVDHRLRRVRRARAGRRGPHPRQRDVAGPRRSSTRARSSRSARRSSARCSRSTRRASASASASSSSSPIPGRSSPRSTSRATRSAARSGASPTTASSSASKRASTAWSTRATSRGRRRSTTRSDLYKKGDDVEAIILSINHDEKKVSLGVKQLWDDPWPTIFNELPPGQGREGHGAQHRRVRRLRARARRHRGAHPAERARSRRRTRQRAKRSCRRWATRSRRRSRTSTRRSGASRCRCERASLQRPPRPEMRRHPTHGRRRRRRRRRRPKRRPAGRSGSSSSRSSVRSSPQISTEKKDDDDDDETTE